MKRKGMWADFTEEDIELMIAIRREAEEWARRATQKSARGKRSIEPHAIESAPDRKAAAKKETGKDGAAPSPRD